MNLTAIIEKSECGFSAYIEQISGVNTQGETLEEIRDNLKDALSIVADLKGIHNYKISREVILDKSTTVHKTC
ncbi:type II toxin-antitoxin system HicB family antitoxin [uncultured Legionella sp.]|uniref:type II toxin-antitoxin system HicB family antitoxin n=1 Tax=uncultured Legionella sp. TaxID=210934 RepID=UPI002621B25F|nr:type II toxin-antitoxin system HicB family antitoxin [uncultured Legionella sp.]